MTGAGAFRAFFLCFLSFLTACTQHRPPPSRTASLLSLLQTRLQVRGGSARESRVWNASTGGEGVGSLLSEAMEETVDKRRRTVSFSFSDLALQREMAREQEQQEQEEAPEAFVRGDWRKQPMSVKERVLTAHKLVEEEKDFVTALELLSDAMASEMFNFTARLERLAILWELNFDDEEGLQLIRSALGAGEGGANSSLLLSSFASEAAIVISLKPTSIAAHVLLGKLQLEGVGRVEEAVETWRKCLVRFPYCHEAKAEIGLVLCLQSFEEEKGEEEEEGEEEKEGKESREFSERFGYLGMRRRKGLWREGTKNLRDAEKLQSGTRSKILSAWISLHEGDVEKAEESLEEAGKVADISLNDEFCIARLRGQSQMYLQKGMQQDAEECLERVVSDVLNKPEEVKKVKSSRALLELSLAIVEYSQLVAKREREGQAEALETLQACLASLPHSRLILFHIAEMELRRHDEQGDLKLACSALDRILLLVDKRRTTPVWPAGWWVRDSQVSEFSKHIQKQIRQRENFQKQKIFLGWTAWLHGQHLPPTVTVREPGHNFTAGNPLLAIKEKMLRRPQPTDYEMQEQM